MTARQKLEAIINVDRTGVVPVFAGPDKACYSIRSLAAKAGIPLTPDILAAGACVFDYSGDSDEPGAWFET